MKQDLLIMGYACKLKSMIYLHMLMLGVCTSTSIERESETFKIMGYNVLCRKECELVPKG